MWKILTMVGLAVLVSGCGRAGYDHPSASNQQFLQDRHECIKGAGTGFSMDKGKGSSCVQGFRQCLAAKGYTKRRGGRLVIGRGQGVNAC